MPPPIPSALRLQWQAPGDAAIADHLGAVLVRQQRRQSAGVARPGIVYTSLGFCVLVFTVATWPTGIFLPLLVGFLFLWAKVLAPRQVARSFRRQPVAYDPYTVTLDDDGVHVVGASAANHLRWSTFETATIDEDVLVLKRREVAFYQLVPLMALGPAVDRAALLAEVQRLVETQAPTPPAGLRPSG